MNKKTSAFLTAMAILACSHSYSQEVGINILFQPATIAAGDTGTIQVDIDNNDWIIDVPVNKLQVTTTLMNGSVALIPNSPPAAGVGSNPDNWTIQSNSGSSIVLTNSAIITAGVRSTFFIKVVGTATGSSNINSSISFNSGMPAENNPANDISTTSGGITAPLPVTLVDFSAKPDNCDVLLNWTTGSESGFHHFDIEKSADGTHFAYVASLKAKGSNSSYTYQDNNAARGQQQYRLKMVDNDGSSKLSKTAGAAVSCQNGNVSVYPNPAQDKVQVKGLSGTEIVLLYDASGRQIARVQATAGITAVNMSGLAEGLYQLIVTDTGGNSHSFKVIKKK